MVKEDFRRVFDDKKAIFSLFPEKEITHMFVSFPKKIPIFWVSIRSFLWRNKLKTKKYLNYSKLCILLDYVSHLKQLMKIRIRIAFKREF